MKKGVLLMPALGVDTTNLKKSIHRHNMDRDLNECGYATRILQAPGVGSTSDELFSLIKYKQSFFDEIKILRDQYSQIAVVTNSLGFTHAIEFIFDESNIYCDPEEISVFADNPVILTSDSDNHRSLIPFYTTNNGIRIQDNELNNIITGMRSVTEWIGDHPIEELYSLLTLNNPNDSLIHPNQFIEFKAFNEKNENGIVPTHYHEFHEPCLEPEHSSAPGHHLAGLMDLVETKRRKFLKRS